MRWVAGPSNSVLHAMGERYKITSEQAFSFLIQASQDANRKLRDVADCLVRTGDIQL